MILVFVGRPGYKITNNLLQKKTTFFFFFFCLSAYDGFNEENGALPPPMGSVMGSVGGYDEFNGSNRYNACLDACASHSLSCDGDVNMNSSALCSAL